MKIGIPGGLLYYSYYILWKNFFENLGAQVITSGSTNKNILDSGVKLCVDEACLPVKIYHGHIQSLSDKVDAIFIPRIMSISRNEYICPKFCGLPDMIKNSIPEMPYMIDTIINLRKSQSTLIDSIMNAASIITKNRNRVLEAYKKALVEQMKFEKGMKMYGDFENAVKGINTSPNMERGSSGIAILGHPYNIYDDYINMNIRKKLMAEGYTIITPEMIDETKINKYASTMSKRHFWTFGRKILGTGLSFVAEQNIDGIIYLSSFGCGIDSLIEDYLERYLRRDGKIPYMKITLDEHSGEAGVNTRLEAFIDMVKWRGEYESNISAYGRDVRSSQRLS